MLPSSVQMLRQISFPSEQLREAINGRRSDLIVSHIREGLKTAGWLEYQFASAACAEAEGEQVNMQMVEVELTAVYVNYGIVDAVRSITGNEELTARDLLTQIRDQIKKLLTPASH